MPHPTLVQCTACCVCSACDDQRGWCSVWKQCDEATHSKPWGIHQLPSTRSPTIVYTKARHGPTRHAAQLSQAVTRIVATTPTARGLPWRGTSDRPSHALPPWG